MAHNYRLKYKGLLHLVHAQHLRLSLYAVDNTDRYSLTMAITRRRQSSSPIHNPIHSVSHTVNGNQWFPLWLSQKPSEVSFRTIAKLVNLLAMCMRPSSQLVEMTWRLTYNTANWYFYKLKKTCLGSPLSLFLTLSENVKFTSNKCKHVLSSPESAILSSPSLKLPRREAAVSSSHVPSIQKPFFRTWL